MCRGIGDVMEFQVQKYVKSTLLQVAHQLRPKKREHLFAHFQTAITGINSVDKCQCFIAIIVVQSDNDRRISNSTGRR
ncbi:hypothetical protein D3C81_2119360 [compost metagenome]